MGITHFRISKLPVRVTLLISAVPVVLNQSYLISQQTNLTIDNSTGFIGEFLDFAEWQVTENEVSWSNPGTIDMKELSQTNTPEASNQSQSRLNENTELTVGSLVIANNSTDRIKITEISGNGILNNNGIKVETGDVFFQYDFANLLFKNNLGGGFPYGTIKFQCGNHLGYNDITEYELSINVDGDANFVDVGIENINDTVDIGGLVNRKTNIHSFKVLRGIIGFSLNVQVVINSPFFAVDPNNTVTIRYNGTELVKTANETFNLSIPIGNDGIVEFQVEHAKVDIGSSVSSSSVQFSLIDMNGSVVYIGSPAIQTSTANFT